MYAIRNKKTKLWVYDIAIRGRSLFVMDADNAKLFETEDWHTYCPNCGARLIGGNN
jgi:hypothetical protein